MQTWLAFKLENCYDTKIISKKNTESVVQYCGYGGIHGVCLDDELMFILPNIQIIIAYHMKLEFSSYVSHKIHISNYDELLPIRIRQNLADLLTKLRVAGYISTRDKQELGAAATNPI
jgi:hypothetical protein